MLSVIQMCMKPAAASSGERRPTMMDSNNQARLAGLDTSGRDLVSYIDLFDCPGLMDD